MYITWHVPVTVCHQRPIANCASPFTCRTSATNLRGESPRQVRRPRPITPNRMANTMPTMAQIHAIFTAVPAIPVNPRTPAISAMTKNVTAQEIRCNSFPINLIVQRNGLPQDQIRREFMQEQCGSARKKIKCAPAPLGPYAPDHQSRRLTAAFAHQ